MTKFTVLCGVLSLGMLPFEPFNSGLAGVAVTMLTGDKPGPGSNGGGQSVTRSATIHLNGSMTKVFPLFEPIGEKAWVPGWDPQVAYPANGKAQEGMAFLTYDEHGKNESYWTVIEYDPQRHRIAYINVIPNYQVRKIAIQCNAVGPDKTDATVSYTYTGVSAHGNDDVAKQTEESYAAKMQHWTYAINHYLSTGKQIEHQ